MTDSTEQRLNMVESQVRPSDVTDRRIIRAMLEVPREAFAPAAQQALAYRDEDLPVTPPAAGSDGRYLLAPRVLAKLIQLAEVGPDSTVLDVGCASGYSSAVLARLGKRVVALESDGALATLARRALQELHAARVEVIEGPLPAGAPSKGPFDAILLNGAVPAVPQALLDQLADGGRLVAVVRDGPIGRARVWRKSGGVCDARSVFDAGAKPLPGFETRKEFVL